MITNDKLREAVAYITPSAMNHGAIMLTADILRQHVATIEAALTELMELWIIAADDRLSNEHIGMLFRAKFLPQPSQVCDVCVDGKVNHIEENMPPVSCGVCNGTGKKGG